MNTSEFRELTLNELQTRRREIREEIFKYRLQQRSGQLEKPSMLRVLRRNVARIKTIMNEKSRATNQITSR